ncbi:MAG: LamG-like jellyroll fold domain-containing protein, partial [Isosphaeraceae bacterium]
MGATVNVQGSAYIDLSQVASGKAVLMLNVDAPAGNPIVTAYGTVDFEFDAPVFNSVQAPSGSSTPQLGDGLALDGSTGYGSASNINLNNTSYTVEFWAQRSAAGQEEYVIGQAPSSSTTGLSIGFDTNNDFVVNSGGTTLSFPAGQDTSWHHWAVTYDQSSETLSIYRDGILETSGTAAPIQGASSTLLVGKSGSIFFDGGVDEVRVWTVARTASQVADNLALTTPSPTTGLLADWSFTEGQGTTAADSSGNNHTLTLTGGVTWAPTVIGGTSQLATGPTAAETASALQLDGTDAYASASGINLNGTSFSIEFWAKQNDTARLEYIINQGDPPASGGLQIGFDASNNFFVSFGGTTLSTPTNDNSWHHWAVTFDSSSGKLLIYQDGVPVAGTTANPIALSGSTPAFLVGKSGAYFFDGDITQVRVWTVARTETDVNSDMISSTPTSTIGLLAAWNFGEGQGTTAADSSGNGHNATISGGATWISATLPTMPTPPFEGFTITISGGVDLTIPHAPGGLEITGTASFRVDASAGSLQLNVSGMVNLAPLGNALDLEGVVHFDLGPQPYTNPTPELYGIFVLQTGQLFNTLSSLGLNVNGMAVLRFNTTSSDIPIDLPIPSSDPTQPAVLQSFVIQADAASVMIQGDVNFQLGGQQWFGLSGTFDAIFQDPNGQAELDILENASLIIGPPAAPIVEFQTTGFLRLWSGGVAAQFQVTFDAQESSVLQNAGLDFTSPIDPLTGKPVANQFLFELNTSGQAVSFTAPTLTSSDPGLTAGTSGLTINIPAGAPQPDGSTAAAGPYMVVEGSGGFELDGSFAVIGSFYLEVTTSQFLLETEAQVFLQVQNNVLLDLQANGGIDISSQGIYGAIQLTVNTGLPSGYGFSLNAGFLLEVNTTSQTPTIAGIALPAGPFVEIKATGDLKVGTFDLSGSFVFEVDGSGLTMTLTAQAVIAPLGQANIDGELVILGGDNPGLYGILQAALASSPDIPDVSLNLNFQFEINTTTANQTVTGFTVDPTTGQITTGQQLTIGAGEVQIDAGGSLTIVNLFDVQGQFDFTINSGGLQIDAQAALTGFFGLNLGFNAMLDLSSAGLVVNAGLTLNESLPLGLLSISASPQLLINTTNQTLDGVAPSTYEVQLNNADVNFLGLQASGTLIVGVSDGIFEIDVPSSDPLQLSFFGLGGVSISGYIDSNGQFSLTGSVGFDLGQSGNDIWGSLQITISNSGFSGYFGGGAQIFGINVASISGWLTIDNGYIDLGASVSVWIFSFGFNIGIGQLQMPQYSPNELLFYSVPTTANAGSTISLNASATDGSGNPAGDGAYSWTIYYDNAVYAQETSANPNLKLGDPGTYQVVMNEGSVTKTSTIQVLDVPPTVSSLNLQTGYADGQSVTLAPSVYSPLPEAPGGLHYQWTILKDGQPFATASTPTYTFTPDTPGMTSEGAPVPDVYQVSLTVSDNYGGSVSASGSFGTFDPNNIVVTTTQDLTQPGAVTSLRVAIQEAESVPGVHYVKFASDLAGQTITLTTVGDPSDYGASAIAISGGTVVLDASNAPGVTIAASGPMRIFYVAPGSSLELQDLNLSGGYELGDGNGSYGGAIYANGFVYTSNCAFVNNTAVGDFYAYAGGGAIYVSSIGLLSAVETTFGDNSVYGYSQAVGGAIDSAGALGLEHVTIAGNLLSSLNPAGGGVYDTASNQPNPYGGSPFPLFTVLDNVLIADNTGGVDFDYEGNSGGQINDALIGTSANVPSVIFQTIGYSPFIEGQNPLLGPLADHGDGVLTFSLMPGSPALNNGIGPYETYVLDGRGYPFPANGSYSIGAFQSQPYVVTNTNDSGPGSLRAAITEDDSNLPIIFAPNLAGQVISLSSGPITITHNLTLQGLGADKVQVVSGTVAPIPTDLWAGNGNTNDTSGAAPGYPVGTLSYAPGIVGQAFQLNGTNAVTIPDNQTLDSSSFTVGGWYNLSQPQNSILASKYGGGAYYNGWILGINGSNQPYFQVLASPSSNLALTATQPISLNAWHYIAATYDGNNLALFVDGTKVASGTLAGGYTPSALPMEIGGASWYPAGYVTGLVNQFAFYSTALTANQITATYDATLSLSQPAYEGYGIFNVASGVTVTVSGLTLGNGDAANGGAFNNAGTLTITGTQFVQDSAPAAPVPGKAGNAYGGAIDNATGGVLVVTDSSFIKAAALGGEGQVSGSTAGTGGNAYGGAIYNAPGALLGAADNTFTGDYAAGGTGDSTASNPGQAGAGFGGAIDNAGTAYLVNVTIAGNAVSNGTGTAPGLASDGAGLYNAPGATLSLTNSIVADNAGADIIVNGRLVAQDTGGNDVVNLGTAAGQSNLVTSNTGLPASTIASTADPDLAHLLNTGGTTSTLVELPGSPAIGAGNTAVTGLPVFPFSIPGLLAWWPGNSSGQDAVGSLNASLQNGATYGPGLNGQAFQFNGTTSYAAIPSSADIVGTGAFSISVWIKTTGSSGVIIQQRDPNNFNGEYQLGLSGGKVSFSVYGSYEYDFQMLSNASVNDGNWHNIVVVRQANGTGEIFIDGNLDSTASGPDVPLGSGFNIYLGADVRDGANYFSGLIENVALFNTALTSANVEAIDQGTTTPQATDQRGDPRITNRSVDLGAVQEQPYVVTNTTDSGPGSLRQEIADDAAGDQPVIFAPSLAGQTITLTSGPITI